MAENETKNSLYNDEALVKPRSYPRMKNKMKKIVLYIESQLGGQVLDLELKPEDIKLIVEQAFEELIHYMTDTYTVSVPYANCIDLSDYNIDSVESVLRAQDTIMTGIPFAMPAMDLYNITGMYNIEDYTKAMLIKRNLSTLSTDMDFVWDKPNRKLYLNANPNQPNIVTINFKPEYYSVEDIRESHWETQLRKLALGMCKIILGRIRSKYTSNSAKFQLDGPTLLAEGNAEVQAVRQYLDDNKDIFTVLN